MDPNQKNANKKDIKGNLPSKNITGKSVTPVIVQSSSGNKASSVKVAATISSVVKAQHSPPVKPINTGPSSSSSAGYSPASKKLTYDFLSDSDEEDDGQQPVAVEGLSIRNLAPRFYDDDGLFFRVTFKNSIYQKDAAAKKVFRFQIMDVSGEIEVVAFGDVAEKFYTQVEANSVYKLQRFKVAVENPNYPSRTGIPYEIVLNRSSMIESAADDRIPQIAFKFQQVAELMNAMDQPETAIDFLGAYVKDWGVGRTEKGTWTREIALRDCTGPVNLTVYGKFAEDFSYERGTILALRNVNLETKTLPDGTKKPWLRDNFRTLVLVNPSTPEAESMKDWILKLIEEKEKAKAKKRKLN